MRPLAALLAALLIAVTAACGSGGAGSRPAVTSQPPSTDNDTPPTPSPVEREPTPDPGAPLYIALGDSLSEGVGASDEETTGFVPLVHAALGGNVGLLNLGHSGDDSEELIQHGHLHAAIAEIGGRNGDSDPGNDVVLVTLEIGGNDLLDLYFDLVAPGTCPNVAESLEKAVCVDAFRGTLDTYVPNLRDTVQRLRDADADLRIVLLTLYNPFSGSALTAFEPIGDLALEGTQGTSFPEGFNDLMRVQAQASGLVLADVYPLFAGKALEYVALDLIHPNDAGYRVMADAVLAAIGQ
jgi:lysophospholipase L1-like esterase